MAYASAAGGAAKSAGYMDTNGVVSLGPDATSSSGTTTFGEARNTAIGYQALKNVNPSSSTVGNKNVALGYGAGTNVTSGSQNTFLGYGCDTSEKPAMPTPMPMPLGRGGTSYARATTARCIGRPSQIHQACSPK